MAAGAVTGSPAGGAGASVAEGRPPLLVLPLGDLGRFDSLAQRLERGRALAHVAETHFERGHPGQGDQLGVDARQLRDTVDRLKSRLESAAVVLGTVADGKVQLVAGVTAKATSRIKAGELVNFVAQRVGGKGGGRPDMAEAGGKNPAALPGALASVYTTVEGML